MAEEMRIVLRNYGKIDPLKLEEYLAAGGYKALEKARAMAPTDLIEEIKKSNLRGRGGAGFNCGQKWFFAQQAQADKKYVICNADEGEPGTYKDRLIMQGDPQSILEGMAICGHAIGAGLYFCRGNIPMWWIYLQAIEQAQDLWEILGLKFVREPALHLWRRDCPYRVHRRPRGEPRFKPPFPGVQGLWGKPTIINGDLCQYTGYSDHGGSGMHLLMILLSWHQGADSYRRC